jgi:hypothetical protein
MHLIDIDIIRLQPAELLVDAFQQMLAGEPGLVRAINHGQAHLGRDHQFVPRRIAHQCFTDDSLALAKVIGISGIEKINALVEGWLKEWCAIGLVERCPSVPTSRSSGITADSDGADFETAIAESDVFHRDASEECFCVMPSLPR